MTKRLGWAGFAAMAAALFAGTAIAQAQTTASKADWDKIVAAAGKMRRRDVESVARLFVQPMLHDIRDLVRRSRDAHADRRRDFRRPLTLRPVEQQRGDIAGFAVKCKPIAFPDKGIADHGFPLIFIDGERAASDKTDFAELARNHGSVRSI